MLFLDVARALKAMHQYRVRGGEKARRDAKGVRREGEAADKDAIRKMKQAKGRDAVDVEEGDVEQEPLMNGEITRSQEGVEEGEIRAYAHRDIKPGMLLKNSSFPLFPRWKVNELNR